MFSSTAVVLYDIYSSGMDGCVSLGPVTVII